MRTLRVPLNFKLITTLYQCANSKWARKMETNILGIRISIFLDFGLLARFQILPAENSNSKFKIHCLGQIIPCLYFCGYVKFFEYTLGIRLGHFR